MRDRSRARNYSASRDEFRRAHERHRAWGLQRRHSERMRQIREREAGCWPADLEALRGGVEDGQSGIADELFPGTERLLVRRGAGGRAGDPPTGSARQAGPAGEPPLRVGERPGGESCSASGSVEWVRSVGWVGSVGKLPLQAGEHPAAKPSSTSSDHGRHPAPALSHEQAPSRDHAPADEWADVTTPRPPARPPRPGRAGKRQARPPVTRHAPIPAADDQQSHDQNTRRRAIAAFPENVLNPRRAPRQYRQRIPP
jgi:hypothetical protein